MTDIPVAPHLIEKLRLIAEAEHRPIEAVLESLIEQYPVPIEDEPTPDEGDVPPLGTLARLAYEARKVGFMSGETDMSERSREILEQEFFEYLTRDGRWNPES